MIELLKKAGWDHANKGDGGGKRDFWYDPKSGEIYEKKGVGGGEPIGWNLKDVPGSGYGPSFSTPPAGGINPNTALKVGTGLAVGYLL